MHKTLAGQGVRPATMPHTLSEVFPAHPTDASAVGFVLSRLPRTNAPILWVQDRLSRKEAGRPALVGIGVDRPVIIVDLSRAADVLWAMEDGLRCRALGAVIGEVWGDPPSLDFTATKRLALRAEAANVACWLIRRAASPDLSAARDRWRIASLLSAPHPHDAQAPGSPRWALDLFRSRRSKPGQWVATYDRAADRVHLAPSARDRAVEPRDGALRERAAG
ncbi:protein ImuA [Yoonia maricola]|uniref:Protein ImuA n=2 Tax=Yoonia maricola TaxID=420999 RepID=A0A2M8WNX4_9RHOB|nr:protein ImuA [Yoonia maricola]